MKTIFKKKKWGEMKSVVAAPLLAINLLILFGYIKVFVKFDCLLQRSVDPGKARTATNKRDAAGWGFDPPSPIDWNDRFNRFCAEPVVPPNPLLTLAIMIVSSFVSYFLITVLAKNFLLKSGKENDASRISQKALTATLIIAIAAILLYIVQLQTIKAI